MIRLYHGSYTSVSQPQVGMGRSKVDFGQGFYLTRLQEQAEKWARIISIRRGPGNTPTVSAYELDWDAVLAAGFRILDFPEYNLEWLNYVVDCRKGGDIQQQYDLVQGGVANDQVIDTIEDYENGRITAQQALGQLRYKAVNHQICIRNQQIIDHYLTFIHQ